ncbi:MAG: DUF134 domain-containing protein [Aminipila sp.]
MPRPRKFRRVCCMPKSELFGPIGLKCFTSSQTINMSVDEYETIRLIDLEGCTQEECAQQMGIARTTTQGIYIDARKKLAEALVEGKFLSIGGGDYTLCDSFERGCECGCKNKCYKKCKNNRDKGEIDNE